MYVNGMNKRWVLAGCLFLGTAAFAVAQTDGEKSDSLKKEKQKIALYRSEPVWIEMAKDSNVNYFEAKKAFDEYWKDRVVAEEFEKLDLKKATLLRKVFQPKALLRQEQSLEYSYEHKRFEHWLRRNEPYVQPDGKLMSPDERVEIWKQYKKQQN